MRVTPQDNHEKLMLRAIQLSQRSKAISKPNPAVGCVIEKNGSIVGEGWTQRAGQAHAEIMALREASDASQGGDVYVSLEPCCHTGKTGPCTDALIAAGVARVFVAIKDPNPKVAGGGLAKLRSAGIKVEYGLCESQAAEANRGFMQRMTSGKPFVSLKMASTIDGYTGDHKGASKWITGEMSREYVHQMRAHSCAVVTGIGTILADNPSLNARVDFDVVQPMRVILDSQLRTHGKARVFDNPGTVLIATTSNPVENSTSCEVAHFPRNSFGIDLSSVLEWLADKQCNNVMIEAGPRVSGSFIQQQLVDEIVLFQAPKFLGKGAQDMLQFNKFLDIEETVNFKITDCETTGNDLMLKLVPSNTQS